MKVNVAGVECNALNDSGCQIPVVSTCLFDWCGENTIGSVVLHMMILKCVTCRSVVTLYLMV